IVGAPFNNSGLVDLQSGTLSLEGSDTSTGDFQTQAGTTLQLAGGGTHNFNAGARLTAAGLVIHGGSGVNNFNAGSTYTVTGTTLNNAAAATYNGVAGNEFIIDGIFNNLATGTFTLDGNNDLHGAGFPTAFNNQGAFIKRAGASGDGVTSCSAVFNNSGVVDL